MILTKIWERYLFSETIKTLLFFLLCLYLTFVLIDFSCNSGNFYRHSPPSIKELALYYLHYFIHYLPIFLPFTLMLSAIKVLLGMNSRNELAALQSAGLSPYKLSRPFFLLASLLFLFSFLNAEIFSSRSLHYIETFKVARSKNPEKKDRPLYVSSLPDRSKLIFQKSDPEKNALFDVFWIKSLDEIYYAKHLLLTAPSVGLFVECFKRNGEGILEMVSSHDRFSFETTFDLSTLSFSPSLEEKSLSHLLLQAWENRYSSKEEKAYLSTSLHVTLVHLLLPFLVLLALFPYLFRFSRYLPSFLLYSLSIFGLVVFLTLLNALAVLGENQILPPFLLIWTPALLAFGFFGFRFFKSC